MEKFEQRCDMITFIYIYIIFFKDFFLYSREKGGDRAQVGGEEGERESQADSLLSVEPDSGLDPTTTRSQPEPKPRVRRLTDFTTQAPLHLYFLKDCSNGY